MRGVKAVVKTDKPGVYKTGGVGGSKTTFWKVGDVKEIECQPVLCSRGFHFFRYEDLCFGINFFGEKSDTVFLEIEALGEIKHDTQKYVTNKIKIVRYIPKRDWKKNIKGHGNSGNWNSGNGNSGHGNSGDRNSGDRNSGYGNSGYRNSGNWNSGYGNSGNRNSGNRNSGNWNSGNWNSGYWNSGHGNSGDWNSCNGYRNYFCTKTRYFLFDVEVRKEVIDKMHINMSWFDLTDKTYKEAWEECPKDVLDYIRSIPQFKTETAKKKFKYITGLNL